jgi:hypothetical protein
MEPAMIEASRVLAGISAALLIVAIAVWVNLFRRPSLQRLDGSKEPAVSDFDIAFQLLVATLVLGGVAAIIALAGFFTR